MSTRCGVPRGAEAPLLHRITLLGTAGGQTIYGDTASGGNLSLRSTSHATKGKIIFGAAAASAYDEVNERLGIGTASPSDVLHVKGGNASGLRIESYGNANVLDFYNAGNRNFSLRSNYNVNNLLEIMRSTTSGGAPTTSVLAIDGTTGYVGVGTTAPTAWLDAKAPTTAAASLRLRTGVAPTSPNDGDIWQDGTNLKIRIGGVTKTFTLT